MLLFRSQNAPQSVCRWIVQLRTTPVLRGLSIRLASDCMRGVIALGQSLANELVVRGNFQTLKPVKGASDA